MSVAYCSHSTDEVLEQYSLGRLPEGEATHLEEHLLICTGCRQRLEDIDEFVLTIRQALTEYEEASRARPSPRFSPLAWLPRLPKPAWAGALAAVVVLAVLLPWRQQPGAPYPLQLHSFRGPAPAFAAIAPAGRPLLLTVDLTGLKASPACVFEIADSSGASVWESVAGSGDDAVTLTVDRTLRPGQYWLRVYESAPASGARGELLREFSLPVK
jgi:hypothetical protein